LAGDVCSGCGAEVRRLITPGGIVRDLDPTPHPNGNHVIITNEAGEVRAKVVSGDQMPVEGDAYRRHECPPKPVVATGPACAACELPMHAELAASQGWATHPSCVDPEDARREALQQIRGRRAG
jgi:hypothetical protein